MKKAISLFLACVVLLLSMSGCSVKAQKDSLAARAGLTSSSQIEKVVLHAGYHPDEDAANTSDETIDLTGTAEGNQYIEALFSDAAADTEEPEAVLGKGYPMNGMIVYSIKEGASADYTQLSVSVYRDQKSYTVGLWLAYTDDKQWELLQEDDNSTGKGYTYLLPDTREIWSREYIDSIFAEKAE